MDWRVGRERHSKRLNGSANPAAISMICNLLIRDRFHPSTKIHRPRAKLARDHRPVIFWTADRLP